MYLSRRDWGALAPARTADVRIQEKTHLLVHSAERLSIATVVVRRMQHRDMWDEGLPDIRFNFILAGAIVIEGRGWDAPGATVPEALDVCILDHVYADVWVTFLAEADHRAGHPLIRQAISEKEVPYVRNAEEGDD